MQGEAILDLPSKSARALAADYELYMRDAWSSKGMLQLIRSRKSAIGDAAAAAAVAAVDGTPKLLTSICHFASFTQEHHQPM